MPTWMMSVMGAGCPVQQEKEDQKARLFPLYVTTLPSAWTHSLNGRTEVLNRVLLLQYGAPLSYNTMFASAVTQAARRASR